MRLMKPLKVSSFSMSKNSIAIIGGTRMTALHDLEIVRREAVYTPYGEPSGPLIFGLIHGRDICFIPRHGHGHNIPPHKVNYRANIWALDSVDISDVIAVNAVGGIAENTPPGRVVIPDQIIDYTYGREHTFSDGSHAQIDHIDFTQPYSEILRQELITAAKKAQVAIVDKGVYGATQGPRLETAAEVNRLEKDGCTLVGMTGMPEAALAREAGLNYACCSFVVNWAAGRGEHDIHADIEKYLSEGMQSVRNILEIML